MFESWKLASCKLTVVVSCIGALLTPAAFAHSPTQPENSEDLSKAVAGAQAVVHAVVTDVQYRISTKRSEREEALPHTFVTYKIRDTIRGKVKDQTLTLRFVGGPDGQGRFLTVSDAPLFNVGHEDILLVQGNGKNPCPLVNCGYGRFRIHEGRVYNSEGFPVIALEKNRVVTGIEREPALLKFSFPAPGFDQLIKREDVRKQAQTLGNVDELKRRYEQEAPKATNFAIETSKPAEQADKADSSTPTPSAVASAKKPLEVAQFVDVLKEVSRKIATTAPLPEVANANPDQPFSVAVPLAVKPGIAPAATRVPTRIRESVQDRRERELLEKQDFDPVIKRGNQ